MRRLLAFDLDGTLLNENKEISEAVVEAVRLAKSKNNIIVLSSGRSFKGIQKYVEKLGPDIVDFVVGFSGSIIKDGLGKQTYYQKILQNKELEHISNVAMDAGLTVHYVSEEKIYSPNRHIGKYTIHEAYLSETPLVYCENFFQQHTIPIYKAVYGGENKTIDLAQTSIPKGFYKKFLVVRSGNTYLEVINRDSGKGNALKFLAELMGIPREQVIAFGDQENDLSMIDYAGIGVSMGNGANVVKKAADYITKTNMEDGVAFGLNKFVLTK